MSLTGKLLRVEDLAAGQREQMFAIMQRHYQNCHRTVFDADLSEKQWVVVAERVQDGAIVGFSTQMQLELDVAGEAVCFLYSGDTIVEPQYWNHNPLAGVWGRLALALLDQTPERRMYWFLISKGYKTYRFLPVFFYEFFPRYDQATPHGYEQLIDAIALAKFGKRFDAARRVICADGHSTCLRDDLAPLSPARLGDPHVAFFCQQNQGHSAGDELCCIAPLTRENFKPAAYRVMQQCPAVRL